MIHSTPGIRVRSMTRDEAKRIGVPFTGATVLELQDHSIVYAAQDGWVEKLGLLLVLTPDGLDLSLADMWRREEVE